MKKLSLLVASMLIACNVFVTGATAEDVQKGVMLNIDGELKTVPAYNIKDNNYFKLRDVANILKGTSAQFDVIWNESVGAIEIVSGTGYSTDEEVTGELLENPVATSSYVPIFKDGYSVLLSAYNIKDNNYFKLRDIASAINFGVEWDAENNIVMIKTNETYAYPESGNFGLNTRYLSYLGKSKAEVDAMHASVDYSYEFGMTTYDNDLMMGWGKLGEDPLDTDCAVSMYVPLSLLFYNCPASLTQDQIKGQFNSSFSDFDMMYEENVLTVNYCGKMLFFYPDSGLYSSSYAFINVYNDYQNPYVENVQIINTTQQQPVAESSIYYDYAVAHDGEFWNVNQHWMDEREYYYLADVDHDGMDEMVVKLGAGIGVFKVIDGLVQPIFCDYLPDSSGRDQFWLAKFQGKYFICYATASSDEYNVLNTIENRETKMYSYSSVFNGDYSIKSNSVSQTEYESYKNSIEYPVGMSIEGLKAFKWQGETNIGSDASEMVGYYFDDETGSYFTISIEQGEYYIDPYIVRVLAQEHTKLIKTDEYTYKFNDIEGREWTLVFDESYRTLKMDYVSEYKSELFESYWQFQKKV